MASVTAGTRDQEVSFISGVNADGTLAGPAFATYNGDTPDTYGNTSGQFHWGPVNTAGTGGGLLNYYFDTNAGWNANEQESLVSGLNMWSAIANISFQQTTIAADANITFTRNANGDAFAQSSSQQHAVGSTIITPPDGNSVTISMDIGDSTRRVGGHGALGDFQSGGYGVSTVLHEEGHALGLGHGGPYNGNNVPSQQLGAYDNQISTTMSYFSPHGSTAYDSPVGATNWTTGGTQYYPTTWMPLDIDAIQRLYGAQTNGPLNTAQTFGYNTTITGSLKPYFDFTINTRPILTLYDTAASGNTLDLSMSSDAATLNLNSGTYSSAFGMTNNIVIYDKTYIQNVYCGSGDDICTVNSDKGNTIDGGAGNNKAIFSGNRADYVITEKNGSTQVSQASKPNGPVSTLSKIQTLQFNDQSVAVCFASGSLILLDRGEVAVERLRVGDVVVTASGEQRAIRWIGHRTIDCRNHPNPLAVLPVRIGKDALGPNKPAQDLWVSPGHAICRDVDGEALIPASASSTAPPSLRSRSTPSPTGTSNSTATTCSSPTACPPRATSTWATAASSRRSRSSTSRHAPMRMPRPAPMPISAGPSSARVRSSTRSVPAFAPGPSRTAGRSSRTRSPSSMSGSAGR
ncbi:Hint domain-containing protein [Methylobacterium sp. 174MFSha1.1]|uniref:Hint domain-containing protein n=1 Tax=Methylobacterium sp. 174MFSha1.1 TaxID=1502749 RepID=UPI000A66CB7F|nr:Hint domain-containing protein [Methylobacterium sp. 174MFSha1.1]